MEEGAGRSAGCLLVCQRFVVPRLLLFTAQREIVHLKLCPGFIGGFSAQESANQIHCYMTELGPNPNLTPA